ncbi:MAG: radical SAM protein [Candidatus Omnitrophica bacterium]|nr:radical SAM protein [Candidatus Omnitrophota bacterium]
MGRIKVCLLFPRFRYISGDPPIGIGYLASYLKSNLNIDLSVIDATFIRSFKRVFHKLKEINPDILGIYSDGIMSEDAVTIADWAKNNRIYTIIGGPQATVLPEFFINHSDIVVQGEGEIILAEIIKSFDMNDLSYIPGIWWKKGGEIIKNSPNQNFISLDALPFPQRDLLPMDKYLYNWNYLDTLDTDKCGTTMIVSRGCPFNCSYCQPTIREMFGSKLRIRSPKNVVEEIKMLRRQYNVDGIFFHDDTFTADSSWVNDFCEMMENDKLSILWGCNSRIDTVNEAALKRMHQAGLRNIHFGIESGSQRILDNIYNKKIKLEQVRDVISLTSKIGIHTMGFFMLGAPSETGGEINNTIAFAKSLRLEEASFSLTAPLVGTHLYKSLLKDNKYKMDNNYGNLNYYSQYSLKGGIGKARIKILQLKAFILFYLHPLRINYIIRHLFSLKGLKKLLTKVLRCV